MAQFNSEGKLIVKIGMWEHAPFMGQVNNCMKSLNKTLEDGKTPVEYKLIKLAGDDKTIKRIDILFLDGGEDVNPYLYGEPNRFSHFSEERDKIEMALLNRYYGHSKISGVCRGLQLINVFFGGTLYQDISQDLYPKHHSPHEVSLSSKESCRNLVNFVGLNSFLVSSYHHQGIKDLGRSLYVTLVSNDNPDVEKFPPIIEGIQGGSYNEIRAVQSHPEFGEFPMDGALFSYLCFIDTSIDRLKIRKMAEEEKIVKDMRIGDYGNSASYTGTSTGVIYNG